MWHDEVFIALYGHGLISRDPMTGWCSAAGTGWYLAMSYINTFFFTVKLAYILW